MFKNVFYVLVVSLFYIKTISLYSQGIFEEKEPFTRQDTLRGSITPEREWWNLNYYHLDIAVNPEEKSIKGKNTVGYSVLKPYKLIQIDLQEPMFITSAKQDNKSLEFYREGNAYFIKLVKKQNVGDINYLIVEYEGKPKEAVRAPWDGGFLGKKMKMIITLLLHLVKDLEQVFGGLIRIICMMK